VSAGDQAHAHPSATAAAPAAPATLAPPAPASVPAIIATAGVLAVVTAVVLALRGVPVGAEHGPLEIPTAGLQLLASAVALAAVLRGGPQRALAVVLAPLGVVLAAEELSVVQQAGFEVRLGGVLVDAPHDVVTAVLDRAAAGHPVALAIVAAGLVAAGAALPFARRSAPALLAHPAARSLGVALGLILLAFAVDTGYTLVDTGATGVLRIAEEALELLGALALVDAAARAGYSMLDFAPRPPGSRPRTRWAANASPGRGSRGSRNPTSRTPR